MCFINTIMNSVGNTLNDNEATNKSNNILSKASPGKKSRARWCILIGVFAVTVMAGSHEVLRFQSSREWITISLPNPPATLPDNTASALLRRECCVSAKSCLSRYHRNGFQKA